jgi:hypothetical protein
MNSKQFTNTHTHTHNCIPNTFFFGGGGTGSHCVAQAGLELKILLPQLPECWDDRHVPPQPVEILIKRKISKAARE